MKTMILCILALVAIVAARPETYTDRFDNIDVDEILSNKRLLTPYIKCMLDKGKCSPEGRELKSHLREALETYCEKCNEVQKAKTRQVISYLVNNESEYWTQLTDKYDPTHKYTKRYEDELRKIKA